MNRKSFGKFMNSNISKNFTRKGPKNFWFSPMDSPIFLLFGKQYLLTVKTWLQCPWPIAFRVSVANTYMTMSSYTLADDCCWPIIDTKFSPTMQYCSYNLTIAIATLNLHVGYAFVLNSLLLDLVVKSPLFYTVIVSCCKLIW